MSMYDTLADYLGGALEGTPEEKTVAARIATDPLWRTAYEDLVAADAAVRSDLAGLAADPVGPPPDLMAMIAETLVADGDPAASPTAPDRPVLTPVDRRKSRWALAGGTLAVSLLALGGAAVWLNGGSGTPTGGTLSEDRAASSPLVSGIAPHEGQAATAPSSGVQSLVSGRNYTRADVLTSVSAAAAAPERETPAVPGGLDRLWGTEALDACLRQIARVYGSGVVSVDYARFEGRPALIMVFSATGSGSAPGARSSTAPDMRSVVAVGPDCGLTGPDAIYSTPR